MVEGKSISSITKAEWTSLVHSDGSLTELKEIPSSLNNPVLKASTIVAVASGIIVPNPGMDILRYHEKDMPQCINLDHYTIIENLPLHPMYNRILKSAKIDDTDEIKIKLSNNVWIVKEPPNNYHWMHEFTEHILKAKIK